MIVDIKKYRRFALNQRLRAPTQPHPIFKFKFSPKSRVFLFFFFAKFYKNSVLTFKFFEHIVE